MFQRVWGWLSLASGRNSAKECSNAGSVEAAVRVKKKENAAADRARRSIDERYALTLESVLDRKLRKIFQLSRCALSTKDKKLQAAEHEIEELKKQLGLQSFANDTTSVELPNPDTATARVNNGDLKESVESRVEVKESFAPNGSEVVDHAADHELQDPLEVEVAHQTAATCTTVGPSESMDSLFDEDSDTEILTRSWAEGRRADVHFAPLQANQINNTKRQQLFKQQESERENEKRNLRDQASTEAMRATEKNTVTVKRERPQDPQPLKPSPKRRCQRVVTVPWNANYDTASDEDEGFTSIHDPSTVIDLTLEGVSDNESKSDQEPAVPELSGLSQLSNLSSI
ncbi:MAG: hypothetical protein MHM6MM_003066 [Cercozoa sp. M6MM]